MTDSSWDNGGIAPKKKSFGTGTKVLLGCGIALLLGIVTCTTVGIVFGNMIKKDPEAFEKRVEGWAKGFIQKDWDRLRALVGQLQTDEGTQAVYQSNPELRNTYASAELFLAAVQGWRSQVAPLPAEVPSEEHRRGHRRRTKEAPAEDASASVSEKNYSVNLNKVMGTTTIGCKYPNGTRLTVTFDGERVSRIEVD